MFSVGSVSVNKLVITLPNTPHISAVYASVLWSVAMEKPVIVVLTVNNASPSLRHFFWC